MDTVLTYEVRSAPEPLQVAKPGDLTIYVTNHTGTPVWLEEAVFAFPVGNGSDDLTVNSGSVGMSVSDSTNWRIERDDNRPGAFLLSPKRLRPIPPGGEVEVTLSNIEVNDAVGTSTLTVGELTDDAESGTEFPLAKVPSGFTVGDFRPEHILVDSGRSAELRWRGDTPPEAEYEIRYQDGDPADVTGSHYWKSPPLHHDTAFTLVVTVTVTGAEGSAVYAMSAVVTVARPNLVLNDLEVNGRVVLAHRSVEFDLGEDTSRVCTAETDGFLVGHILSAADVIGDAPAPTLSAAVTIGDSPPRVTSVQSRWAERAPYDPGTRLVAVVPKGSAVTISRSGTPDHSHTLTWVPFGTGELKLW
ncbi:hypothetical protein [Allokutzneria albata]|uniref:Uncharacterized protein n=1 Tax=Allokutzneria albata TaxID=211114 RepID=A0A1G9S7E4_ALLAB|nr:hypothetical protein [Allokutzneria albata]SDM31386.1 hypothetical protein SAMN04489726_0943 [Allokutzneria albata]